ncbi:MULTISPECIES: Ger(x)C family spore germination protein [Alicyclobacillus]|uniref:Ger(X)C family spore germination protein n=1 Tax=Alicyclobacillus acidoterrestris (strain ATCC 49025 / DSM 3922 / CIP 106132 / NCIMB 13137 / GD3B) TaxID=1356854 RepID=T0BH12_ALIAG|nr:MULTISPECIES: Ger(x)C family spore germination protein [Alicyclobacillus]EPZ43293.1 hypothetical protein N007_13425 [Alicyclobacillus acidoterrestris ATCC 49025]UNO47711.1 Ger(x)C family spore germination protein [Alicyclobacillus acidoterrestris]GEO27359.1 putative spore germination protein YfkR [Alicyclobacillus acidoterrestris]
MNLRTKIPRMVCCIVVLASCLMCTGCWDATEIDRLAIVSASGIDLMPEDEMSSAPPKVLETLQIARASEMGSNGGGAPATKTGSEDAFLLEQATGDDILQPMDIIRKRLSRKLFLGQRRVIVLGENYAKHGVYDLVDEVIRNPQSRLRTYVVVAYHDTAQTILQVPYALNRLPADAIAEIEQQGSLPEVDAKTFIQRMVSNGDTFVMGIEKIQPSPQDGEAMNNSFALTHIAIFRQDKLVGWLDGDTLDGFLWMYGRIHRTDTTVTIPGVPGHLTARMLTIRTKRSIEIEHGKPKIAIHVFTEYDVAENGTPANLNSPENVNKLRKALVEKLTRQIQSAMDTLQHTYDADPLGFGDQIDKRYPTIWKAIRDHWHEVYRQTPVNIEVDVQIRNSGLTGPPIRH